MPWICDACAATSPDDSPRCVGCDQPQAEPASTLLQVGAEILERYRITAKLGEGAMGVVYRAEQRMGAVSRPVAIKVLHSSHVRDPSVRARFLRECEVVVRLEHPNTIKFFDFGQLSDGSLAIVMEYVDGESLGDELARGPLAVDRVLRIVGQICGSLHEAHSRGIVHRDLKPDNVLLGNVAGERDVVKVLDFGIAAYRPAVTSSNAALTTQGMLLGTPRYMSPEQFLGRDIDGRSDIYSLAAMTYEMLTGVSPFAPATTIYEWAERHLHSVPTPIDAHPVAAAVSREARAVLMQALAKEPGQRPPSVLDFAHGLIDRRELETRWGLGSRHSVTSTAVMPSHSPGTLSAPPLVPASASPVAPVAPRRTTLGLVAFLGILLGAAVAVAVYFAFFDEDESRVHSASVPPVLPPPPVSWQPPLMPDDATVRRETQFRVEPPVAPSPPSVTPDMGPSPEASPGSTSPTAWLAIVHHQSRVTVASAALGPPDQTYAEIPRGGLLTLELAAGTIVSTDGGPGPDLRVVVSPSSGPYRVEAAQSHQRFQIVVSEVAGTAPVDLDQFVLGTARYIRLSSRSAMPVLVDAVGVYRIVATGSEHPH